MNPGTVYLIGAGPGDPGLVTVRGLDLLRSCDVVVHDYLCHPDLLREARGEVVFAGKGAGESFKQAGINELLVARAREGKSVARLKGGDPCVFGRGGEEAEHLAAHGIPFEIVPGVSSITAVPAYAGIPLTHRDCCSEFLVVTGHVDPAKGESSLNYAELASFPGTRVLLMGVGRLRAVAAGVLAAGGDAALPVAVIQWGTWGRQRTVTGPLAGIADAVEAAGLQPPAVVVMGGVVAKRDTLSWFEARPLFGRRVVVTQLPETGGPVAAALAGAGADVVPVPMLRATSLGRSEAVRRVAESVAEQDWAVFTSAQGWEAFYESWRGRDLRGLGGVRLAVLGRGLATRVGRSGVVPEVVASPSTSAGLARTLVERGVVGARCAWFRGNRADREFSATLSAAGAVVTEVEAYRTDLTTRLGPGDADAMRGAEGVVFSSPSAVEAWVALPAAERPDARVVSIGPSTSAAVRACGLEVAAEAGEPSPAGIVSAVIRATVR